MAITLERIAKLPLRRRIAWGAFIIKSVLDLYSDYFWTTFKPDEGIECAWDYVLSIDESPLRRHMVIANLDRAIYLSEKEYYQWYELGTVKLLLAEIEHQTGKSLVGAVDYAAISYAQQILYRQNRTSGDRRIPVQFTDRLTEPVLRLAEATLECLERNPTCLVNRDMFSDFHLEFAIVPVESVPVEGDLVIPVVPIHEVGR
jgi:hypothetical protein